MSCACENKRMSHELERYRRLARAWARLEGEPAVIYRNSDGSYGFVSADKAEDKEIVEFVSSY